MWNAHPCKHETYTRGTSSIEHWYQVWQRPSRFSLKSRINQEQPPTSAARNGQKMLNIEAASTKNILAPALKAWRWCHPLKSDGSSDVEWNSEKPGGEVWVKNRTNMHKHVIQTCRRQPFIVPPSPLGLILCVIDEGVGPAETTAPHSNKKHNPVMTHHRYPGMTQMAEAVYMKAGNMQNKKEQHHKWLQASPISSTQTNGDSSPLASQAASTFISGHLTA